MIASHLHADAVHVIDAFEPRDVDQARLRLRYLQFLASHRDAMSRDCVSGHLTASTLVLDPSESQVLLTLHRKSRRWLQFGGHTEFGDTTLLAAAEREAREESGLPDLATPSGPVELDEHALGPNFSCAPTHLDVRYLVMADSSITPKVSEESHDVRWFPFDAPEIKDESLRRLIARAVALAD